MTRLFTFLNAVAFLVIAVWALLDDNKVTGMASLAISQINICAFFILLKIEKRP